MAVEDDKTEEIAALLDGVSQQLIDLTGKGVVRSKALATQKCSSCGKDATEFKDEISKKEYRLTAWCQQCQDDYYGI